MTKDNNILATFVTYKKLYNDKHVDVYDIISEFVRYIIVKEHKKTYSQLTFPRLISEYFDFQIPSLVLKPAILRIKGVTLSNQQYNVDYSVVSNNSGFDQLREDAFTSNALILDDLIDYIKSKTTNIIDEDEIKVINKSFRRYILDESTNDKYDEYISAFIIEKSSIPGYVEKINQIREGHILYNGLSYNEKIMAHGWKGKLTIYLDMEILFHIVGYNGKTFEQISNEFLSLVSEANKKEILISLKFFPETKKEIKNFFDTAETIFKNNQIIKPGQTAMESILADCKSEIDITNKMNSFFYSLKKLHINEETKSDFYSPKYESSNLESIEYTTPEDQSNIKLISHINKLRQNDTFTDYSDSKALLISETGSLLELSRKITSEKETKLLTHSGYENRIVTFVLNLYTITNILWYRLNKSLHSSTEPSTFNAVIRAQIVLSKYVNESITKEYNELIKKQKSSEIDKDELAVLIVGMRRYSSKPEDIINEGVDNALEFLCEKDINKFRDDYEIEKNAYKQLNADHNKVLSQLAITNETVDNLKHQNKCIEFKYAYQRADDRLTILNDQLISVKRTYDYQCNLLSKSKKNKSILLVLSYFVYYIVLIICIIKYTWNIMEPITFILGIPPFLYPTITKFFKLKWSFSTFIDSYESNKLYINAKLEYESLIEEICSQESIVKEKYNTFLECEKTTPN